MRFRRNHDTNYPPAFLFCIRLPPAQTYSGKTYAVEIQEDAAQNKALLPQQRLQGFKASRLPLTFSEGKPYERKVMQPERLSIPPEGMLGQMQGLFFYCTPPFGGAIKEK
jgi:hypothetical protein